MAEIASPELVVKSRGRLSPFLTIACFAPSLILTLSAYVPLSRTLTSNDIDWPVLLDELHARDLSYGRDIVYTFGPWGFVWGGTTSSTLGISCIIWGMGGIIAWSVLRRVVMSRLPQSPARAGAVLLAIAMPLGGDYVCAPDVRLLLLPFLLVLYHFFIEPRDMDWLKLILIAAVAFAGLIKFNCFVGGAVAIAMVTIDQLSNRQRRITPLLAWIGTTLLAWLRAGQNPLDLPLYIRHSLSLTGGYADMMSLSSPHESRQVLSFVIPVLFLMLLLRHVTSQVLHKRSILFLVAMLMLMLMTFRCGYVRHDVHELTATVLLLEVAALYFLIAAPHIRGGRETLAWGLCLIITCLTASQSFADWHGSSLMREWGRTFGNVRADAAELARLVRGNGSMVVAQRNLLVERFKQTDPLPLVESGADLYTRFAVALLANGIPYNPRPTLQSYAATSASLTALNAAHLAVPDAPDHIFINTNPASEHLPALLDNRSWIEFLSRYRLREIKGDYLHLVKHDRPRSAALTPIAELTTAFGSRVNLPEDLPSDGLIWAQVEVHSNPIGWLTSQAYKPPRLSISVTTRDGRSHRWRFVPALGADGFILGPLITDKDSITGLLATGGEGSIDLSRMPRSIAVGATDDPNGHLYYRSQVRVRLFSLRFAARQ